MRPLRVCIDARLVDGASGGVQQVVMGLAHGLSSLTDGDEEYVYLTYSGADGWLRPLLGPNSSTLPYSEPPREPGWRERLKSLPGLQSLWHRLTPMLGNATVPLATSNGVVESAGVDLMHFTFQYAFLTSVPSIYHPHDLQHLHLPEFFTPRNWLGREAYFRGFCEQARMVAVTSTWVRDDVIRHYGLPEEKVQVVPWAPAVAAYPDPTPEQVADTRRKFDLPGRFIFYPAQTWPHKNHIRLLEALALLRDRDGIVVPFVSSGTQNDFFPQIQRRIRELGLERQVWFVGFVSPVELRALYHLCVAAVIPTKFEAASGPLWEAFSDGVPTACSNVTSLPAQAGDAALIFDPDDPVAIADCVARLWSDADLRRTLVDRGRANVARFSWDRTARMFRAHYRRLAGRELSSRERELLAAEPLL